MNDFQNKLEEYKELGSNIRHYGNMRFAQLTLFLVLTGGLVNFHMDPKGDELTKKLIPVLGIAFTLVFWRMEERSTKYWCVYVKRAENIESELQFHQYKNNPKRTFLSATNAVRFLFLIIFGTWICYAIHYYYRCV